MAAEGVLRRRYRWARRARLAVCRAGLHFLTWDHQCAGYRCGCGRNFLWAEQIR
ncbi:hypothetical protein [Micromonospora sp. NPDC049891]|uniref:hypothetical protein n=1 Tax=Micromonospora sp. NPDC049891 TaxID=3155655 RepID=UPI0033CDA3B8